jgi:LysR family transcriptional regulator, glycine cleavage system transcriptional activator
MPLSLPPLTSLRAFEAAARSLSFTKAARELHVTPAAISHQIRGLENFLGVTLFQRAGRRLELTRDGQLAADHFSDAFERIARGVQALRPKARDGELAIGVTPAFATRWLLPRLPSLVAELPQVRVTLVTGTAPVDFDCDEIDVGIRFGQGGSSSTVTDLLFNEIVAPVASPAFVRRHQLRRPVDLARVRLLHDESMRRAGRPPTWTEWLNVAGATIAEIECGLFFDDSHLTLQAACEGQGVALGRLAYAVSDLAQGRLVLPFGQVLELDMHYQLIVPKARAQEAVIARFRQWLLHEADGFRGVLADHAQAA